MRTDLYPEIEPYNSCFLKASELHSVHYEECGNPKGMPVLFLHGGPGGGILSIYRRYFDPNFYRIILVDQRGAGKSTPAAELEENTTWNLVADLESIRKDLKIEKWLLFGGSWGSTLSLIYAISHPEVVSALCLRGIFLCRPQEIKWFYQEGASRIFPDIWTDYLAAIPEAEHSDLVKAYYTRLTSPDKNVRVPAALAWTNWESYTSKLILDKSHGSKDVTEEFALQFARIECHYFSNGIFLDEPNWILNNIKKIRHLPCKVIHGRYDVVCPIENAFDLKHVWPELELEVSPNSGHSASELPIQEKLVSYMEEFKSVVAKN